MHYATAVKTIEAERRRRIGSLFVRDGRIEPQFHRIAQLALALVHAPHVLVTIEGAPPMWLGAKVDASTGEQHEVELFGASVSALRQPITVLDAANAQRPCNGADARPHALRFRAGVPLLLADGVCVGSLCVMNPSPRSDFDEFQQSQLGVLADICADEIDRQLLLIQSRSARGFAEASRDVVLLCTPGGTISYVNQAATQLLGFAPEDLVGRHVSMVIPERYIGECPAGGKTFEAVIQRKDGRDVQVDLALKFWRDGDGINMGATLHDITDRKLREAALQRVASTDSLTGLMRSAAFRDKITEAIEHGGATLFLLDLNAFKTVNDSLGHAAGDALLKALAVRLVGAIRFGSNVGRLGGDEFGILIPGACDTQAAEACAADIQGAFADPFEINGQRLFLGVSVGCAIAPQDATDASELLAAADLALYKAKGSRGRPFRFFEQSMRDEAQARRALQDEARAGFEADEFVLFYQPQVDLKDRCVIAAEALMRWKHPQRGLLFPGSFLSVMQNTSLALSAGYWSIEQACKRLSQLQAHERGAIRLGVNLFAAQLHHGNLVKRLEELLDRYRFPSELLELEITEGIAGQDDDSVITTLKRVRDLGIGLALDDFGIGYASLRTIKRIPATTVKIDQSFVRDLHLMREDAAIVSAIMHVAHSLDLTVIAEGIETQEQEFLLRAVGCHMGQGYLYGRAVAAADFDRDVLDLPFSLDRGARRAPELALDAGALG